MDHDILSCFISWANSGVYPDIKVANFDLEFLVDEYGLEPVNAFLVLSCLKTDPDTAFYSLLCRPAGSIISQEEKDRIRAFAESRGVYRDAAEDCDLNDIEVER